MDGKDTNELLAAFSLIAKMQSESGTTYQKHCVMKDGKIVATNGIITLSIPCLYAHTEAYPSTFHMLKALKAFKDAVPNIVVKDSSLVLTFKRTRITIPCLPISQSGMPSFITPQNTIYTLTETFIDSLKIVAGIPNQADTSILGAAVQLSKYSLISSDRYIAVEANHGSVLPEASLPLVLVKFLLARNVAPIGYTRKDDTVMFIYDDGSFVCSNVYADPWPSIKLLEDIMPSKCSVEVPTELVEGISTIKDFVEDNGFVYLTRNVLSTTKEYKEATGAAFKISFSLQHHYKFKHLKFICENAMYMEEHGNSMYFRGNGLRGLAKAGK